MDRSENKGHREKIIFATGFGHEQISRYAIDRGKKWILIKDEKQLGTLAAAANCVKKLES